MGKTLYLECYSGISGDMTVAALLDLGADPVVLNRALDSLPVNGFRTEISRVQKSGLDACDFSVILEHDNHDHDMEYLHGHTEHHSHEHHSHEHNSHEHHSHEHHSHEHRGLTEIREIIMHSQMTDRAKEKAMDVFQVLAEAESKAHGVPVEQVHFHEVGAVDSIVDIAAVAICMDNLDISEVIVPTLYEGTGFIRCQHGQIPVPVPAVAHIVKDHRLKLKITDIQGELVTPTGAAIVAAFRTADALPEEFTIEKVGMGAGKRQYQCPGVLRAMLLDDRRSAETAVDKVWKLETDIDDGTGETLGYLMQLLMENGAREAHYTPVYMKKNRPAYSLTVLCEEKNRKNLENIIFRETTSIGIRRVEMERTILKRKIEKIETPLGIAAVKICVRPDGQEEGFPEYESAAELAQKNNISFREAYDRIKRFWTAERQAE